MTDIASILEDFQFLEGDDRYGLLIELGRELEPMPAALKTEGTLVKGCASQVWVYPVRNDDGSLHFYADGTSAFTKGVIALVLKIVQDRQPAEISATDIYAVLAPFKLDRFLTANRVLGVPNMIKLVQDTAQRLATGD